MAPKEIDASNTGSVLGTLAEEIKTLCEGLKGHAKLERGHWMEVGVRMANARDALGGSNKEFRQWLKASGLLKLDVLQQSATRSDAMWMADRPDCVGVVPEQFGHPKRIRQEWRALLRAEAQSYVGDVAGHEKASYEWMYAVAKIQEAVAATQPEADDALDRAVGKSDAAMAEAEAGVSPEKRLTQAWSDMSVHAGQLAQAVKRAVGAGRDIITAEQNATYDAEALDGAIVSAFTDLHLPGFDSEELEALCSLADPSLPHDKVAQMIDANPLLFWAYYERLSAQLRALQKELEEVA